MILDRLTLSGFRLHRRTDVIFGPGLTAIVGVNGAGKSTMIEAIVFVLFGEQRGTKETLRGDDGAPYRVRLEFRLDGIAYVVERRPDRASLVQGEVKLAEGLADTTRACSRLLGLTYEQFRNSFLAEQKGLAFLRFRTAAARQEEVARMLGLDRLRTAEAKAADARRTAAAEARALEGTAVDEGTVLAARQEAETAAKAARTEVRVSQVELKRTEAEANVAEPEGQAAETYLNRVSQASAAQEAHRLAVTLLTAAQREQAIAHQEAVESAAIEPKAARFEALLLLRPDLERAQRSADAAEVLQPRGSESVSDAKRAFDEGQAEWRRLRESRVAEEAAAREALRSAREDLREAETGEVGAPCPVCGRPLGEEAHAWREELAARIESAETRVVAAAEALATPMSADMALLPDRLRAAELRSEAVRLRAAYPAGLPDLLKEIEVLRPAAERAKGLLGAGRRLRDVEVRLAQAVESERHAAEAAHASASNLAETGFSSIDAAQASLGRAAAARAATEAARAALRAAEAALKAAEVSASAAETRLKESRARREALRAARHAEALNGAVAGEMRSLRATLNGALRPELEARAAELLERMTAGRYRSLRLSADFEPTVVDDETDRAVLSGGEEDVVALALRLALAELVQDQQGHSLTLLMLDEAFGALDTERRQSLLDVLVGLRERYAQVIVVSHVEEIAQVADRLLRVTRDATGAARVEEA